MKMLNKFTENSKDLRNELTSWFVIISLAFLLFLSIPWLVQKTLYFTLSKPFEAQRVAITKSNKTSDTASGVEGTYINNIPFNDFEKLMNFSNVSFKSVDIQIPRIYITSPIFNTSEYGDQLQDIWIDSLNKDELEEEFGSYKVYYDGNLIIENGASYTSEGATKNQIISMKETIVTEFVTNKEFKKYTFKKYYIPDEGTDPTEIKIIEDGFAIETVFEQKDLIPNIAFGPTLYTVRAEFIKENNKLVLRKGSMEVYK
ncbi:hypothetical protein [Streptococcus suis]|uniref:hypothetical protein n=1 Tax=Streptococcus suis TaxID=1307 RepID=UPI003CEF1E51